MESEGGPRLSKRFSDKGGEVDNQTKSGTAWSHSFLNQKPWHPLSYPNQRRKWIAEQIQAQHDRRAQEVSREFAQEQEFFRQAALISKKDKEKIETMKAVSFMYVRPPGYNPESAKAAELADESMRDGQQALAEGGSTSMPPGGEEGKKKPRPKDVFGRNLPTENEFEVLKNAPRMETGLPTRAKPFGVEVRNVKCVRCNTFGHQSGDRECPLKDAIMPNEESRLKRDDPLTAILAHTDPSEPLKWELKQKPGISPPRGGFRPDDPNQQIVAEGDDIFDEYGGFLGESLIPELLANFSSKPKKKSKKKNKRRRRQSPSISGEDDISSGEDDKKGSKKKVSKLKKKTRDHSESSSPEIDRHKVKNKHKESYLSHDANDEKDYRRTQNRPKHSLDSHMNRWQYRVDKNRDRDRDAEASEDSEHDQNQRATRQKKSHNSEGSDGDQRLHKSTKYRQNHSYSSEDSDSDEKHDRSTKNRQRHSHSYNESQISRHSRMEKIRDRSASLSEDSEADRHPPSETRRQRSRQRHSYSSEDSDRERYYGSRSSRNEPSNSYKDTDPKRHHSNRTSRHKH